MATVENTKAPTPAKTDSDNKVRSTLVATLPQRIVANVKLESARRESILTASPFPPAASISRHNMLTLKRAKFSPENMPVCAMQNAIPIQRATFENGG